MAAAKYRSPFLPIDLGYDDKKELCRISKRVLSEVVASYEKFAWHDNRVLNPSRWACIKTGDDVQVYHERRGKTAGDAGDNRDLEVLMTVGSVVGSLDDAMYGVVNRSTDAMRLNAAYLQDNTLSNCAVLATVQAPKSDKPFRSVTVKWFVKTVPLAMRALMKPRDLVVVEATGIHTLSSGERMGFHLMHSIDHLPETRPLPIYVRASVSMCTIWRQQTPDSVEVFVKTFVEPPDRLLASSTVKATAESLISVWRHMHVAQMKKLSWLLRGQLPIHPDRKRPNGDSAASSGRCQVCTTKAKLSCVVCDITVCAKCCVKRDLWTMGIGSDDMVETKAVVFCLPCLTVAMRTNAQELAREEVPQRKQRRDGEVVKPSPSVWSSSSSSSSATQPQYGRRHDSLSSSTSSERTQDTYMSHSSSKPSFNSST